ncbi:hypothetical protein ACFV0H_24505 [Streptomyces erythrochromogenes]|uniref:Uncharacterized protein n=1 Tax=Streptomyces erythrochromogenes TaxID=285574 RepID=A0ABZ1QIN9_9ACTN|nr:hypothetical protein [Streptomyces erythrochromogenes]
MWFVRVRCSLEGQGRKCGLATDIEAESVELEDDNLFRRAKALLAA